MYVSVYVHLPLLIQVKESDKKVNLNGRPLQHTEVGKGVQADRPAMALSKEHMVHASAKHSSARKDWEEGGGRTEVRMTAQFLRGYHDSVLSKEHLMKWLKGQLGMSNCL